MAFTWLMDSGENCVQDAKGCSASETSTRNSVAGAAHHHQATRANDE
jgi:hypothetical protein